MTEIQRQVIFALKDADCVVSAAAKILKKHRNAISYHIENIKDETGLDPRKFNDFLQLLDMATAGENLSNEQKYCSRCGSLLQKGLTNKARIVIMSDDNMKSTNCVDVNICVGCSSKLLSFARGAYGNN